MSGASNWSKCKCAMASKHCTGPASESQGACVYLWDHSSRSCSTLCVHVSMCQLQGRQGDTQLLEAPTLYMGIYGSSYWQTQTHATKPRQQGLLALSAPTCSVSPHTHYGMHKQSTYWLDNRNAVVDKEMTGVYKYENMNYKLSSFNLKKLMALK